MFKNKVAAMVGGAKKMEKRDLMQATLAGAVMVAFADGQLEDEEVKSLHTIIESQPALQAFGAELSKTLDQYIDTMKASRHLGKIKLMKEIEDIKANGEECNEVFAVMLTIAESDGQIEPEELKLLSDVGRKMGINVKDWGLA